MEKVDKKMLEILSGTSTFKGAYNIRKNGKLVKRDTTDNIEIKSKEDKPGIDIIVKDGTKFETVNIPVILTESISDEVYNDFYIGKDADVVIVAGCGLHNDSCDEARHDGIHRFFLKENAKVKYIEKHYGEGDGKGKRVLNPLTEVHLDNGATMEMETTQIKGVDSTVRTTNAVLNGENTNLVINEKIMTHGSQSAKTIFSVELNGKNSSTKVNSRSFASENSSQEFVSNVIGNNECFGHVECDAIIDGTSKVTSIPKIVANNIDANLIHEAAIGKIAGEQLIKLMTLGLTKEEAEKEVINGFLR